MHAEKCPVCKGKGDSRCCGNKGWVEVSDSDKQKEYIPYPIYPSYPQPYMPLMPTSPIIPDWTYRPEWGPVWTIGETTTCGGAISG